MIGNRDIRCGWNIPPHVGVHGMAVFHEDEDEPNKIWAYNNICSDYGSRWKIPMIAENESA